MFVGKNILFLYSGLQQKLFMQQSIVIIKQFIDEIEETQIGQETNFFILTTTDLAKVFFDDNVTIIQDKITRNSVLSVVEKYKIDAIISVIGDENNDKILNCSTFLDKKGLNIFYKKFYIANRSKRHFENIAKQSGFYLDKGKTLKDRTYYEDFVVVAIKDKYNNQHILDFFSTASMGSEKLFFAPAFLNDITDKQIDEVNTKLRKFSESLSINNLVYIISFSIDENGRMIFNNIKYGLTDEAIFSLQRLQINIATITRKIFERKILFFPLNKKMIAYSLNYKDTLKIHFVTRLEDCCLPALLPRNKHINNKCFVDILMANKRKEQRHSIYFCSKKISTYKNDIYVNFLSSAPDCLFNKIVDKKNDNRYVLIIFDGDDAKNCNNTAVFINICNRIKDYTGKEIVLLCECVPPMLSLVNFKHIVVVDDLNKNVVANVIGSFGIKYVYVDVEKNTNHIISAVTQCGAKIYGFDRNDAILYDRNDEVTCGFERKIKCNFKDDTDNADRVFDVFCSCDKYNNSFFNIILSRHFSGDIETNYVCYPAVFENFEIQPKIEECIERILENIKTSGLIHIVCVYKNSELSILDVSRSTSFYYFVLNASVKQRVIIDTIVKSLLDGKIDMAIRENRNFLLSPYRNDMFYRTMIFSTLNNCSIAISGHSNKSIKDRYNEMMSRR